MQAAYYNENDPYCAAWLKNLINAKLIAPGDIDDRSIKNVSSEDIKGYTQAHFFAGIGGWSFALRLASWPDETPVWTGSCPCQPFSAAGKRQGTKDPRHLWPTWFTLIKKCHPPIVFGEQVASAIRGGWLDSIFNDMEAEGYACAAAVLPACSVGAPHLRQRCWFVANADGGDASAEGLQRGGEHGQQSQGRSSLLVGHSHEQGSQGRSIVWNSANQFVTRETGVADVWHVAWATCHRWSEGKSIKGRYTKRTKEKRAIGRIAEYGRYCDWIPCTDGKMRPVESGTFPLAHGIPKCIGRLRAYGNAIVPQVAAEFIKSCRP